METTAPKPRSTQSYERLMAARRRASEHRATDADARLLATRVPRMSVRGGAHEDDLEIDYSVETRRKMLPVEEIRSLVCAPAAAQHCRESGSAPTRRRGSRRTTSTRAGPDDDEGSEPEPARACLCGCETDISQLRAGAEFLNDTHSKRYRRKVRRQELRAPETIWAAADREGRADWQDLGDKRREDRIFHPGVADDEVDQDGLLQALMQGYVDAGGYLHPLSELRPEAAKSKKLHWNWAGVAA
jgi:hypothetical protein